jgi:transcriptional regulator of acetoin/glycerol metabolism
MLPSAYPYDYQKLKAAWTQFVEQGTVASDSLDPAVVRSWQYCREAELEPCASPRPEHGDAETLSQHREDLFDLIAVARPFKEDIYQFAGESDMMVFLTNADLYILDWLGDSALEHTLQDIGIDDGTQLSEAQVGTNAAAIALNEGMPSQVVGPEHFFQAYHSLTGTAAPIHAPTGEMMGVIGIVTLEPNSHPHTLSIAMAAARAIENQLQTELSLSEAHQHLAELNVALQATRRGIVFLDPDGRVSPTGDGTQAQHPGRASRRPGDGAGPADLYVGKGVHLPDPKQPSPLPYERRCAEGRLPHAGVHPYAGADCRSAATGASHSGHQGAFHLQ